MTENTSTTLDLIFVNNCHCIVSHGVQESGISDHSIVFATKEAGVHKAPAEIRELRSYKNYNKDEFQRDVARVPWRLIESFDDINDAVEEAWNILFLDVANRYTPMRHVKTKCATKPWITSELQDMMAKRDYTFKLAKRSGKQD